MDTSNKDEEEEEELSSEDDLKKEIGSTIDYLIEHDKKELVESVKEIHRDEEIIDAVTELEELTRSLSSRNQSRKKSTNFWINYLNPNMSRNHCS